MSLETILPFIRFCRLLISHPRRLSEQTNLSNLSPCQKPSGTCHKMVNPLTAEWAITALIDFTLSNARRFYSSKGNPLDGKGLSLHNPKGHCFFFLVLKFLVRPDKSVSMRAAIVKTTLAWLVYEKQTLTLILIAGEHKHISCCRFSTLKSRLLVHRAEVQTLSPLGEFWGHIEFWSLVLVFSNQVVRICQSEAFCRTATGYPVCWFGITP